MKRIVTLMFSTKGVCLLAGLAAAALAAPALAADSYKLDPSHTSVVFRIKHLNMSYVYGRFNDVSGNFAIDEQDAAKSRFEVTLKTDSIDTGNAKRDQHLKSPDFFNAKEFGSISFKSKEIKKSGENTFDLTGDLTLHGVTKPITVKLQRVGSGKDPWGGYRAGFETVFSVKRSDFGMNTMPEALGDEVRLMVSFEGVKE